MRLRAEGCKMATRIAVGHFFDARIDHRGQLGLQEVGLLRIQQQRRGTPTTDRC